MVPFSKRRSLSCASSSAAANFVILVLTFAPAACSAAPPTVCERLPKVPMPCFTTAVSPWWTVTWSNGTPNWSASICAKVVSLPCPCGETPVVALIRPSRSTVTCECSQPPGGKLEEGPRPQLSTYIESPRPTAAITISAAPKRARHFSGLVVVLDEVETLQLAYGGCLRTRR